MTRCLGPLPTSRTPASLQWVGAPTACAKHWTWLAPPPKNNPPAPTTPQIASLLDQELASAGPVLEAEADRVAALGAAAEEAARHNRCVCMSACVTCHEGVAPDTHKQHNHSLVRQSTAAAACRSLVAAARRKVDLLQGMLTALLQQQQGQQQQEDTSSQIPELRAHLSAAQVRVYACVPYSTPQHGMAWHGSCPPAAPQAVTSFILIVKHQRMSIVAMLHHPTPRPLAAYSLLRTVSPHPSPSPCTIPPPAPPAHTHTHSLCSHLQSRLAAAEGRMAELASQLNLMTAAGGALAQQLGQQQEAAAAAAAAARQVRAAAAAAAAAGVTCQTCRLLTMCVLRGFAVGHNYCLSGASKPCLASLASIS